MKLKVKSMDDRSHDFEIEDDSTVGELRQKVAELYNIPSSEMTLIYSGRVISNGDATIASVGLANECTLHMIKRAARPTTDRNNHTAEQSTNTPPTEPNPHPHHLHASLSAMPGIPENITQYINRVNPLRARYQQRSQEIRQRFPMSTTIPQRNEDLEFLFAKMSGAGVDWNRFYPNYTQFMESEGLSGGEAAPSNAADFNPLPSGRNPFDNYFQEYMRHLSETLAKLDCVRNVMSTTLQELRTLSDIPITGENIENVQSRITSTMENFCRIMVVFSIMMQQLSSVQFNFDTTAPFTLRTTPKSLTTTMQESTLSQLLGNNLFTTNTPSSDMTSGIAIPIIAGVDSSGSTFIGTPADSMSANTSQTNLETGNLQQFDEGTSDELARSIRDLVSPILDSISANMVNVTEMNLAQQSNPSPTNRTRQSDNNNRNQPRSATVIINNSNPSATVVDVEFLNNLASTDERYRTFLESEYRRMQTPQTASTRPPSFQRSFNYLRDVANDQREIERIEAASQFFCRNASDFIKSSKPYNDHVTHLNADSFRKQMFDKMISSPQFNKKYRDFIKAKLIQLQSLYRNNAY